MKEPELILAARGLFQGRGLPPRDGEKPARKLIGKRRMKGRVLSADTILTLSKKADRGSKTLDRQTLGISWFDAMDYRDHRVAP
jgi:hypothetical protein